jgi:hypothetical protein
MLNKTPAEEAVTIDFMSGEGDRLVVSAWNIQHANRVGLRGVEPPS